MNSLSEPHSTIAGLLSLDFSFGALRLSFLDAKNKKCILELFTSTLPRLLDPTLLKRNGKVWNLRRISFSNWNLTVKSHLCPNVDTNRPNEQTNI